MRPAQITTTDEAFRLGQREGYQPNPFPAGWPTVADLQSPDAFVRAWQDGWSAGYQAWKDRGMPVWASGS